MASSTRAWASARRLLWPALCFLASLAAAAAPPVISVQAEWPNAYETGPTPGLFLFTRTGDVTQPLSVDYQLSGSASKGDDYLVWEPRATFAAGAATARVAILPVNDAVADGDETVLLALQAGDAYTVGVPSAATVTISDAYLAGSPGVWDTQDVESSSGRSLVPTDIGYLDAWTNGGNLEIDLRLNIAGMLAQYAVYVDADQNPATGDYRQGRLGGMEYRVSFDADLTRIWHLYRLRTEPPSDPNDDPRSDILLGSGDVGGDILQNTVRLTIPLALMGSPEAVDVVAVAGASMSYLTSGDGDRCPDYGVFDTATRRVTVRRPGVTQRVAFADPVGDASGGGFDITMVSYASIADQFMIGLYFTEAFDPSDSQYSTAPTGAVTVDGDRDLLTGDFGIGGPIPTFGGDNLLYFSVGTTNLPSTLYYIQTDTDRSKVYFGGDANDASWLCYAPQKALYLSGSLSLLDAFRKTVVSDGTALTRVMTDGLVRVQAESWELLTVADAAPASGSAFDTTIGVLLPYQWDAGSTVTASDPEDMGGQAGVDWTRVDAEVVDGNLVVKGTLAGWLNTDYGNRLEVLLDTDMNALTGDSVNNPESGGPAIGVDNTFAVHSVRMAQDASVGYFGMLTPQGGATTRHDAAINVKVNSAFGVPGWFTATIPLRALIRLGPSLRLYLRSGYFLGPSGDTAPPEPMVIALPLGFTLADAAEALRVAAGLEAYVARLDVDGAPGISIGDALRVARIAAGLDPSP